jgi:hypothetical protein
MSIWTIRPETETIDLQFVAPDGATHPFTITVKKRLTVGEQRRVQTAGFRGIKTARSNAIPGQPAEEASTEISVDWPTSSRGRSRRTASRCRSRARASSR